MRDKRTDFIHAYLVAAREAVEEGNLDEAHILNARAQDLQAHVRTYPRLDDQPETMSAA